MRNALIDTAAASIDVSLLTTYDAARVLDLTPEGVRYLVRQGQLPARKTINGRRLFRKHDVLELLRARGEQRIRRRRRILVAARTASQIRLPLPPPVPTLYAVRPRMVKAGLKAKGSLDVRQVKVRANARKSGYVA